MSAWVITDGEGKMPVAEMRELFERVVLTTEKFRAALSLSCTTENGRFYGYIDETTDRMWFGFAVGMRMAERLRRQEATGAEGGGS